MTQTSQRTRVAWIDYAKAIAIIAVVLRHAINGLDGSGLVDGSWIQHLSVTIPLYSFDMPLFFLLGGLFIARSAQKPFGEYTSERLRRMVYPYFVWSIITYIVALILANYTNGSVISGINEIWYRLFVDPGNRFWFLYGFFVLVMLFAILVKLKVPLRVIFLGFLVVWALSLIVDIASISSMWADVAKNLPFFAIGMYFSEPIRNSVQRLPLAVIGIGTLVCLGILGYVLWFGADWYSTGLFYVTTGIGTVGAILLAVGIEQVAVVEHLSWLGEHSLEIYVVHGLPVAGTRILLERLFDIYNGEIHLLVAVLMGIYFPMLLVILSERFNFHYLFRFDYNQKPKETANAT